MARQSLLTAKYRMQTLSSLYPISFERAVAVAKQIKLSKLFTHIEASRFSGFLFENVSAATLIKMRFSAKRWPTTDDDLFLMYVERSPDVSEWIESCTYEYEPVEIVAILFGSIEDQESFENVIWPQRALEGVEIC